jgi:O-antigen/teichoic acid export membrane protein
MSKSVKRVVKNSFFQTAGAFTNSVINFVLTLGYARFLGPETYGSLVTSQAQVLVWLSLVDLGLSNSLISALTGAESGRTDITRQGFRARDLLFRVLYMRLIGAVVGCMAAFAVAWYRFSDTPAQFWQEVAFTPYLFALALQSTAIAYSAYMHKQGLSVIAMLVGMVITTSLTLTLAWKGAGVPWLLLSQSWGGLLSAAILFGYFYVQYRRRRRIGATRRLQRMKFRPRGSDWGTKAWFALFRDAWPYAIAYGVMVLWQRLDQLAASNILGLAAGGQYALAVRLVSVPVLVATSISMAIFPDLQRVGRDAPHRVRLILAALSKAVYRYGIPVVAVMVFGIGAVIVPLVPKFRPALWLLPHFLPGIWAFWLQSFITNALFGLRAYKETVKVHLASLVVYVACVFTLPRFFGLPGVVWAFDLFCLSMCFFGFRAARKVGLFDKGFAVYRSYTAEERELLGRAGLFSITKRLRGRA